MLAHHTRIGGIEKTPSRWPKCVLGCDKKAPMPFRLYQRTATCPAVARQQGFALRSAGWFGFGIGFSIAASAENECQIQNHTRAIFAGVPWVLTSVNEPAVTNVRTGTLDDGVGAVLINGLAFEGRDFLPRAAVAIPRTADVNALLLGALRLRKHESGGIGIARLDDGRPQ